MTLSRLSLSDITQLKFLQGYVRVKLCGQFFQQTKYLQDIWHWIFSIGGVKEYSERTEQGCFVITTSTEVSYVVNSDAEYLFQKSFFLLDRLLGVNGFCFGHGTKGPFSQDLSDCLAELRIWIRLEENDEGQKEQMKKPKQKGLVLQSRQISRVIRQAVGQIDKMAGLCPTNLTLRRWLILLASVVFLRTDDRYTSYSLRQLWGFNFDQEQIDRANKVLDCHFFPFVQIGQQIA